MNQVDQEQMVLEQIALKLKIGSIGRHIFLCVGEKCCDSRAGQESWEYLKRRLKEVGLPEGAVYRTKVGCLRVCRSGPIGVVYPEGTWYKDLTPANIERILQEHFIQNRPCEDLIFARSPLPKS